MGCLIVAKPSCAKKAVVRHSLYIMFIGTATCFWSIMVDLKLVRYTVLFLFSTTMVTLFQCIYSTSSDYEMFFSLFVGIVALLCNIGFTWIYVGKSLVIFCVIVTLLWWLYLSVQVKSMSKGNVESIKLDDFIMGSLMIYYNLLNFFCSFCKAFSYSSKDDVE